VRCRIHRDVLGAQACGNHAGSGALQPQIGRKSGTDCRASPANLQAGHGRRL